MMTTVEKIVSPSRENYAVKQHDGSYEIDGLKFFFLKYTSKYYKIPGIPSDTDTLLWIGFSEEDAENVWVGFKKFARILSKNSFPIKLEAHENEYCWDNGYLAVYCADGIAVFNTDYSISIAELFMAGFEMNMDLFVPLGEIKTAIYEPSSDTLIRRWKL